MNNKISTEIFLDSDATTFADNNLFFNLTTDVSESSSKISASTEDVEIYDDGFHLIGGKHFISKYPGTAIPYLVIAFTASIAGTLGNIAVLFIIFVYKPLKNARNAFLVNLALADLLVTAVANPFGIIGKSVLVFVRKGSLQNQWSEQVCYKIKRKIPQKSWEFLVFPNCFVATISPVNLASRIIFICQIS